jgi:hypothetical protein
VIPVRPAAKEISAPLAETVRTAWMESRVCLGQVEIVASRDRTAYLAFRDWRDHPDLKVTPVHRVCQDTKGRPVNKEIQACQVLKGQGVTEVLLALQGWKASRGQWAPRDRQD